MKRRLAFCALAVAAVCTPSSRAAADPALDASAKARALFEEGRNLAQAGDYVGACPKFDASQQLHSGIGTLYNLADCYERTGRAASAWSTFLAMADAAERRGDAEAEKDARARADRLASRVPHVVIVAPPGVSGLQVWLDGAAFGETAMGTGLPVDAGTHTVEAEAPGKAKWKSQIQIAEGKVATVEVPPLADVVQKADEQATVPPLQDESAPVRSTKDATVMPAGSTLERRDNLRPVAAIAMAASGALGLAAGAYFGLSAFAKHSDSDAECPRARCTAQGVADNDASGRAADASTLSFTLGAMMLAAGTYVWLSTRSESPGPVHITPSAGVRELTAVVDGTF
jgi:hypothetical protein